MVSSCGRGCCFENESTVKPLQVTAGTLTSEIVALKPALVAGTRRVAARHKDMETTRADVAKLVGRYNEFVSAPSRVTA